MKIITYQNEEGEKTTIGQYEIDNVIVSQELGDSPTDVVSQQKITKELTDLKNSIESNLKELGEALENGYYTIDFVTGSVAQEYTADNPIEIIEHKLQNVAVARVTAEDQFIQTRLYNSMVLPANTLITWEITKTSPDLPALIWIKYKLAND